MPRERNTLIPAVCVDNITHLRNASFSRGVPQYHHHSSFPFFPYFLTYRHVHNFCGLRNTRTRPTLQRGHVFLIYNCNTLGLLTSILSKSGFSFRLTHPSVLQLRMKAQKRAIISSFSEVDCCPSGTIGATSVELLEPLSQCSFRFLLPLRFLEKFFFLAGFFFISALRLARSSISIWTAPGFLRERHTLRCVFSHLDRASTIRTSLQNGCPVHVPGAPVLHTTRLTTNGHAIDTAYFGDPATPSALGCPCLVKPMPLDTSSFKLAQL